MSLRHLNPAAHIPQDITAVIEIPAHSSSIKYEFDKESDMLMVDRFMPTAMHYPCNYGFVPNTLSDDGDPTDILVLTPFPLQPGCVIHVRALAMLAMTDESGEDAKILAVPTLKVCPQFSHIETIEDVSPVLLDSIIHFFENYKALEEGKWVKINGWKGLDEVSKEVKDSIARYKNHAGAKA